MGVCLAWLPVFVVWGPAPFALTFDDAYYYFQIGRELARGHGSTFNGLDHTNGYHPLWQLICAAPFVVGLAGLAAVRALLVLQLGLWALTLWIVAGIVGPRLTRTSTPTVAVLLALAAGNPYVIKLFVNGLESGITAVAYAALLAAVIEKRTRWIAPLLVLAFLSRTDAVFVIACLLLWRPSEWRRFIPVGVVAVLYLGLNEIVFGNPLQVSGVIKRQPLTIGRMTAMLVIIAIALAAAAGCRRMASQRLSRTSAFASSTGWFAAACVLLTGYYQVMSVEVYLWYYAPVALYLIVLLLHLGGDLAEGVIAEGESLRAVQAILVVPLVIGFLVGARFVADPHRRSLQEGDRTIALFARDSSPPGTVLASWDAGIIGYFSDRPVVNLDGVVNSFEWEDALHHAPSATRRFLDDRKVGLIVNHGELIDGNDPDIAASVAALWGDDVSVTQVGNVEYVYSGTAGGVSGTRPMASFVYLVESP